MAGVITHMVVAKEIVKCLPEGSITDMGLFYLGNLAPDSIHAREGYIRPYKKHTHFRDDIPDKDFGMAENLALFHSRVSDFIIKNRDRKGGLLDLYRGYVCHVLTDELFMLTIREEFCAEMEKLGIGQSDRPFFDLIVADMNRNDLLLVDHYEGMDEIRQALEQVPITPIEGYLSAGEVTISRDWLVHQHFHISHEALEPVYIKYDRMLEFIDMAAKNIPSRLSEGGSLPRMFWQI